MNEPPFEFEGLVGGVNGKNLTYRFCFKWLESQVGIPSLSCKVTGVNVIHLNGIMHKSVVAT